MVSYQDGESVSSTPTKAKLFRFIIREVQLQPYCLPSSLSSFQVARDWGADWGLRMAYRGTMSKKKELFGSAGGGDSARYAAEQTRNLMEEQNNAQISMLKDQVSMLKELSLDINVEVNDQNKFLGGMETDFDSTQGLLGGTMGKLKTMVEAGGSSHMCLLIGFVVFVFLVIYWILGHKG